MVSYEKIKWELKKIYKGENYRAEAFYTKKYGDRNPDKRFYVFSEFDGEKMGILSCFLLFLPEVEWAVKNGYIPVFDLQTQWPELSQDKEMAYKENAWDYYFEQRYKLDEIYESKNVTHGWKMYKFPHYVSFTYKKITSSEIARWSPLVKRYMNFSDHIIKRAEEFWCKNSLGKENVLGIELRPSFIYCKEMEQLKGHPIQKDLEIQIYDAQILMRKWKCSKIFVMCEDRSWIEKFEKTFKGKCVVFPRARKHLYKNGMKIDIETLEGRKEFEAEFKNVSVRRKTEDYLIEVYLLSKCNSLYSCMASAGIVAQIYNGGKYENVSCSENGRI